MQSTAALSYFVRVMGAMSPQILACIVGLTVSFVYMSRCRMPAIMVMAGCIIGLVSSIGTVMLQTLFLTMGSDSLPTIFWSLGILRGIGFAAALGKPFDHDELMNAITVATSAEVRPARRE